MLGIVRREQPHAGVLTRPAVSARSRKARPPGLRCSWKNGFFSQSRCRSSCWSLSGPRAEANRARRAASAAQPARPAPRRRRASAAGTSGAGQASGSTRRPRSKRRPRPPPRRRARRRRHRARDRRRDHARARDVLDARRRAEKLGAEALSRTDGQPIDIIPAQPRRDRVEAVRGVGAVGRRAHVAAAAGALQAERRHAAARRRVPARSRSSSRTPTASRSARRSISSRTASRTSFASTVNASLAGTPFKPTDSRRRRHRRSRAQREADRLLRLHELSAARGDLQKGRDVLRVPSRASPRSPCTKASSTTPASTITTSSAR